MSKDFAFSASDDAFLKAFAQTRAFLLGRPVRPAISPDGVEVLFLRSEARSSRHDLFALNVASGQVRGICTASDLRGQQQEELTAEDKARRERQRLTDTGLTSFEISSSGKWILIPLAGGLYLFERSSEKSVTLLPSKHPSAMDARFTPDGKGVSFVSQHNLWRVDLPDSIAGSIATPRPLTVEGTPDRAFGLPEFVAQEEMGRFEGYWFSPDGQRALVAVVDERPVEIFSIPDPLHPERAPVPFRYPRPGKSNADVGLVLVATNENSAPITVTWDRNAFPYLARVLWQSAYQPPAIWVQSRDQKTAAMLSVELATGSTTVLFTEYDDAWINLDAQLPRFLPDGSGLLLVSEATGGRQLQLRSLADGSVAILVPHAAGFLQLAAIDQPRARVLVLLGNALTSRLAWVSLLPGVPFSPQWLVADPPGEQADRSAFVFGGLADAPLLVETKVAANAWPSLRLLDGQGSLIHVLPSVAEDPPFTPTPRFEVVASAGFHAVVVKPIDFAPDRAYPVIVHVYGGPHALLVKSDQRQHIFDQWLANLGAIVVAVDSRGTPRRGRDWERQIKGAFGDVPLQDQVDALQALALRVPQMDLSRVGIYGWSFGGYMAALAVLRRPDVFKVAVAGAPVVDWMDYDTHYTERYLGLPEQAPSAYTQSSLLTYAGKLEVPLLLVHGTADDNVYFFHSLKLADALLRNGQNVDFLPLPGTTHQIGDPIVRERLWRRVAAYLFERL
jgi:dipeptidyl-peptidase 4